MATSVQVLCPNGHRQTVKVTPNTKLLQVLEEVCSKQGFLPTDEYNLIHGRTTVDLSSTFRFSNLPNNAKLELSKATKPRSQSETEVTIALHLENGDRLQNSFYPSTSLWDILNYWESQDNGAYKGHLTKTDTSKTPPVHPVCIYMREEVIGEDALRNVTLKKLALTSGKAIIRLVHRPVDDTTLANVISQMEKEKAKQNTLEAMAQKSDAEDPEIEAVTSLQFNSDNEKVESPGLGSEVDDRRESMDIQETAGQESHLERSTQNDVNATQHMGALADEQTRSNHNEGQSSLEQIRRMNIPGLEIITPDDFYDLSPEEQQTAQQLAQQVMPALFSQQKQQEMSKPKNAKKQQAPRQSFADFKFPEETKGRDLYHNELSEVKVEEFKPCEREAVVFDSNEERSSKTIPQDVGDDFFEITEADLKSLMRDLQKQVSSLTDRPLMTESMRQTEMEQRYQHYHSVVLRVQFTDGLVLQGCFRPRETVFALYKFVKENLEDPNHEFYLYTSPPKRILSDMALSLVEADLAPATVVYFGSSQSQDHWLSEPVRSGIVPKLHADELSVKKLAKKRIESMSASSSAKSMQATALGPASGEEDSTQNDRTEVAGPRRAASSNDSAKMPKWLKLGNK
ncbi:hypothetical protein C0Q70_00239 [Pomacea canaliculata]|uniref:UBX domain-containing protein n=1 Tax=Pomacea canaliculata TaxID=400727 RepID=A0A2T7PW42_POMCA|nr:tether containing UBX domain for GLUT4-like [Pomacea canaliculata]PVD37642.1 hypothetical protein C0Q70_00239 [Pomacea canaliculata]